MKQLSLITCILMMHTCCFAQGNIMAMHTDPAFPTSADDIRILVEIQFPSSSCDADYSGHSMVGSTIDASAHHCMGMLTAICNTTDTFQLGQLPAGNYTFNVTLSSGFGGPGCSPGIAPDDMDQFQFSVSEAVGIDAPRFEHLSVFPNPTSDFVVVENPRSPFRIISLDGKQIMQGTVPIKGVIDLRGLVAGFYVLEMETTSGIVRAKFSVSR